MKVLKYNKNFNKKNKKNKQIINYHNILEITIYMINKKLMYNMFFKWHNKMDYYQNLPQII